MKQSVLTIHILLLADLYFFINFKLDYFFTVTFIIYSGCFLQLVLIFSFVISPNVILIAKINYYRSFSPIISAV